MPKNIVICSDGTGNSGIKDRGTNVFKLFESIDLNGQRANPSLDVQIALYDDGVGTETFLPLKILGGAFGWGLARNVRQLYMGLVRIYDPGDRIFLFGFSRGAFTVRTLVGMIARCGVLDRERLLTTEDLREAVKQAYRTYRRSYRTWLGGLLQSAREKFGRQSDTDAMREFKAAYSLTADKFRDAGSPGQDVRITFLGVWDTVDAVGGPFHISDVINTVFHRFKFSDRTLSPIVEHAAQALSIDDARAAFEPVLWKADQQRVEQVWFAGVHSNVGGGYPKQGMSLVTLDWMMQKAAARGLRILTDDRKYYAEHGSTDDKSYDSRAGLGVFYRWKPRNMQKLWDRQYQQTKEPPVVHVSVLERIAHGTDGYAPGTLAAPVKVACTPSSDPDPTKANAENQAANARAKAVESALNGIPAGRRAALEKVRGTLFLGRLTYYLYVLSCLAVILAAAILEGGGQRLNPWTILKNAGGLILNIATGKWAELWPTASKLMQDSPLFLILLLGFVVAGGLAKYVDHVRSMTFSRFWHDSRQDLRSALKAARQKTLAASAGAPGTTATLRPPTP
jgi:uncharacterized protein (DUF2235 family)